MRALTLFLYGCGCGLVLGVAPAGEPPAGRVEPPATSAVEPALAPDPAILEILGKLGDNSSALLPATKVVGDPGPLAREYRMVNMGTATWVYRYKKAGK